MEEETIVCSYETIVFFIIIIRDANCKQIGNWIWRDWLKLNVMQRDLALINKDKVKRVWRNTIGCKSIYILYFINKFMYFEISFDENFFVYINITIVYICIYNFFFIMNNFFKYVKLTLYNFNWNYFL